MPSPLTPTRPSLDMMIVAGWSAKIQLQFALKSARAVGAGEDVIVPIEKALDILQRALEGKAP